MQNQCYHVLNMCYGTNVGDALNPYLLQKLFGIEVVFTRKNPAPNPWYFCCGSVLHLATDNTIVWGSGCQTEGVGPAVKPLEIRAVRGPNSRQILTNKGIYCPEVYGDPALLLPLCYKPEVQVRYLLGCIPHYVDKLHPSVQALRKERGVIVIDVMDDVETFVRNVLSCEYIVSSSLHGLIIADAYGVPNRWTKLSADVVGGGFKFTDYFASVGRTDKQPVAPQDLLSVASALHSFPRHRIELDTELLLKTNPFESRSMNWRHV